MWIVGYSQGLSPHCLPLAPGHLTYLDLEGSSPLLGIGPCGVLAFGNPGECTGRCAE